MDFTSRSLHLCPQNLDEGKKLIWQPQQFSSNSAQCLSEAQWLTTTALLAQRLGFVRALRDHFHLLPTELCWCGGINGSREWQDLFSA